MTFVADFTFDSPGHGSRLAVFNGTNIEFMCEQGQSQKCGIVSGEIYAMAVMQNQLFVGGNFVRVGSLNVNNLARWNGLQWHSVTSINGVIYALEAFQSKLVIGGEFTLCDGQRTLNLAEYTSGYCSSIIDGLNGPVYDLSAVDNCLYVCGSFNSTKTQQALYNIKIQNLVRWCVGERSSISLEAIDFGSMNAMGCRAISKVS